MKSTVISGITLACLLAMHGARSEPVQAVDIVSEPLWVFHVDVDSLKNTVIGRHILAEMNKPETLNKLAAFQAIFNMDLRTDLHGITFYGVSESEDDAVMLVYANFDPVRLTTLALAANGHKSSMYQQHTIHSWIDEKRPKKGGVEPRVYAAIHGKKIIFGRKETRVAQALDVLDGTAQRLQPGSSLITPVAEGAFVHGAATKFIPGEGTPNAEIFRQSKGLRFSAGEKDRQLTTCLILDVGNEEAAKQIEAICRGMVGLMAFRQDQPEVQRLAQAITVRQQGLSVIASLTLPSDEVVEMIKNHKAKSGTTPQ
ncbi:MAG: hypothetical protein N3G20_01305 [Verrucomicrobiae bacterium]|nr:hypothetical protein [Verrucomicrobiae bacterium]